MTLALLLAAFLAVVLTFGLLVAMNDAIADAWRHASARRLVGCAVRAPQPCSRPEAEFGRPARQPSGFGTGARAPVWVATAPARGWRHLH
jgi:hypothetical protein